MSRGSSLRGRLAGAMGILLLLVLLTAVVGVTTLSRVDRITASALQEAVDGGNLSASLASGITDQLRLADRQLFQPSPEQARRIVQLSTSTHRTQQEMRTLPTLTAEDHARLNRIAAIQARIEVAYAVAGVQTALGLASEAAASASAAREGTDTLLAEVRELAVAQSARTSTRADRLQEEAARRRAVLWFLFFTALAIGVTSAWLTIRAVDGPLARLVAATQRFGGGDLRAADLGGMPAELAALGSAMNAMGARIRQMMGAVQQESREIGASASDFSAMSEELAATSGQVSEAMVHLTEAAEGQVVALREADARLEELRVGAAGTLRAAQRVSSVGATITAMAGDHGVHVRAASATLLAVRESVRASAAEVREAMRLAERLSGMVERDRQLATKVGVLAVNTSIEAARAGVHGQGITAVAEELRLLGEMCDAAADDGERSVMALQAQVKATAATLDAGSTSVLGVEATADRAASALSEIARGIAEMNRAAEQVVHDASSARSGMAAMLERTAAAARAATDHAQTGESVSAAAEEQAAATEEMATAAARLNDAAQRLTDLMREFRT